jgi:hypothetical protein
MSSWLGFEYLLLRSFARAPGSLVESPGAYAPAQEPAPELESVAG